MKNNTKTSFSDKWHKNPQAAFKETTREGSDILNWILTRNGFKSKKDLTTFLKDKSRVLDAGCGNGRVTYLLRYCSDPANTEIVGCDLVAADVAKKNLSKEKNVKFYSKDLLGNLKDLGKFDFIYCQEVLHHTANPARAFGNLAKLLNKDGTIAIYVYKKKAPIREYVDDYIRDQIAGLSYKKAMEVCRQITLMGKQLSELKANFKASPVDVLEIPAGEFDVQRFIYHFFMKCFWNPDLSMQENIVINYDWYHPQNCSRHTLEEVKGWFKKNGLRITHAYSDFYGITVHGKKVK